MVYRYADAPNHATMRLHVVHMHVVAPVSESACYIGAD